MPNLLMDNKDIKRKVLDLLLRVKMTMNALCERPYTLDCAVPKRLPKLFDV